MHYLAVCVGQTFVVPFVDVTFLTDGTMNEERYAWISAKIAEKHSVNCKVLGKHMLRVTFDTEDVSTLGNIVFHVLHMYASVHSLRYYIRDWNNEPINQGLFRRWNFYVYSDDDCESCMEETSCVTILAAVHLAAMTPMCLMHYASCNIA